MSDLLTTDLGKVAGAVSDAGPALVVLDDNGAPSYPVAYKGKHAVDFVHIAGAGALDGSIKQAQTDKAPALAAAQAASGTTLYIAWKVAGTTTVRVLQRALVEGTDWADLPLADGGAPLAAQTDAAPALAVGAEGVLYMAWKAPGASGYLLMSGYDGQGWSPPEVYTAAVTDQGPALAGWLTSGPGSARPMCLAWKEAGHSDVLWSFFTPGAGGLSPNRAPGGVATQAAPALCTAPSSGADTFYLAWAPEKGGPISFAPVTREAMGAVLTLPQAQTNDAPAIGNWSNSTSGFGAEVFNDLIVGFTGRSAHDVWRGGWAVVSDPAPGPSAGLASGANYILCSGDRCASLTHVVVTITTTAPLAYSRGYSFQLNCNTPTDAANFSRCHWQQCGWQVDSSGNLQVWVNNWTTTDGYSINTPDAPAYTVTTLSSSTLPAGYHLTITLDFDHHDNLVASTFVATDETGHTFPAKRIDYLGRPLQTNDAAPHAKVTDRYIAPICTLQMNIVGFDNQENAHFRTGAGSISYSAKQKLTAKASIPSCADQFTTLETSNILYGAMPATHSTDPSQMFGLG